MAGLDHAHCVSAQPPSDHRRACLCKIHSRFLHADIDKADPWRRGGHYTPSNFCGPALWGASHIPPNGDVRSLLLFGTVADLALSATQSLSRTELKETDRYTGRTQARLGRMQPSSGVTGG